MNKRFLYGTVSTAIEALRKAGFNMDFNIKNNNVLLNKIKMDINDLRIVKFFRYEGDSDPADEASVYGLESRDGFKGILVTGDDANSDVSSGEVMKKLHLRLLKESD